MTGPDRLLDGRATVFAAYQSDERCHRSAPVVYGQSRNAEPESDLILEKIEVKIICSQNKIGETAGHGIVSKYGHTKAGHFNTGNRVPSSLDFHTPP